VKNLIVIVFLLSLAACYKGGNLEDEKNILKHVVVQYNIFLADGYRSLNMSKLNQVATVERAGKAYYHMSALGEARIKMDARQESIDFSEINIISDYKAEIKTKEKWEYIHINIDTDEATVQNPIYYELTYTLTKKDDRWFVSDIAVDKETEKK
jgi:hypothetical protein